MAKADLGTKRACLACGMRFYDFSRSPIVCPGCGAEFDPENIIKSRKGRPAAKTMLRDNVDATEDDQCVLRGNDIVDWLVVEGKAASRTEATLLARRLTIAGHLSHVQSKVYSRDLFREN